MYLQMMTLFSLPKCFDITSFVLCPLSPIILILMDIREPVVENFMSIELLNKKTAHHDRKFNVNINYFDANYDRRKDIVLKTFDVDVIRQHS